MNEVIRDKIKKLVSGWSPDLKRLSGNKDIIAIIFGAQLVYHGYELYLSGHESDDEETIIFAEQWAPENNFIPLGEESIAIDRLVFLEEYESIVKNEIINLKDVYRGFAVFVGLADSDITRLK